MLYDVSRTVSRVTGLFYNPTRRLWEAFAHESGIHADGVIKKAETYEPITLNYGT